MNKSINRVTFRVFSETKAKDGKSHVAPEKAFMVTLNAFGDESVRDVTKRLNAMTDYAISQVKRVEYSVAA